MSETNFTKRAQKAANARWATEIKEATHGGVLNLAGIQTEVYVAEDGTRLISGRGLQDVLSLVDPKKDYQVSGARIPRLMNNKKLQPLFEETGLLNLFKPIKVQYKGRKINGYEASLLADLCALMIKAKGQGLANTPRMKVVAERSEDVLVAFAKTGLSALIDEATGYQNVRENDALQRILNKYLDDYAKKWAKTFPDEFWTKLLRAKGYDNYIGLPRPQFVGHWINDIVYSRLAPGVLTELKNKNPRTESGGRKYKHTQFLTDDKGIPELKEHLIRAMTIFDLSVATGQDLDSLMDTVMPKYGDTLPLDFSEN